MPPFLIRATEELGFTHCTEIQALTLPVISRGEDIAAQAQTGTGKTAAFLLGSFAMLAERDVGDTQAGQPRMLVLAPTRELAVQIEKDAAALSAHSSLRCAVVYGGVDYEKQRKLLSGRIDVLVGTPGRLIDYYKQKVFTLKHLEILVLDEADRMFDLGFIADIRYLLRRMPPPEQRLSMLFSATLSHRVMELAYEHMNNPVAIKSGADEVTAQGVRQVLYQPGTDEKIPLLLGLLDSLQPPRSIVFVNTKRSAETIAAYLKGNEVNCGILSGDVRQRKRQRILSDFTSGSLPVLIATDVAARGLHINDVSHVFNFDLPQQAEDYVHRIGRTARAGTEGVAVSFACENYSFSLPEIQEYIGQSIPLEMISDDLLKSPRPPVRERTRDRAPPTGKKSSRRPRRRKPDGKSHADKSASVSDTGASAKAGSKPQTSASEQARQQPPPETSAKTSAETSAGNAAGTGTVGDGSKSPSSDSTKPHRSRRRRRRRKSTGEFQADQPKP